MSVSRGVARVIERCAEAGINAGYALGRSYEEYPDGLLVAITEQRSRADIDRFADGARERRRRRAGARGRRGGRMSALEGGATPQQRERATTIFEKGAPGRRAFVAPELDVPEVDPQLLVPQRLRRAEPPRLPEASEPEIVRHYVNLSKRNFDLDSGFYPLGSCTMKHNPRLHERVAALPGHAGCIRCRTRAARRARSS